MNVKSIAVLFILFCLPIACSNGDKNQDKKTDTKATIEIPVALNDQALACREIMASHCTSCHQESRICAKLGQKSQGQWERTIKRMIKHGAKLNNGQKDALVQCLANQDDSIKEYCK